MEMFGLFFNAKVILIDIGIFQYLNILISIYHVYS
jgi:hypothetical protein